MFRRLSSYLAATLLFLSLPAFAETIPSVAKRWTFHDQLGTSLEDIVARFSQETGIALSSADFTLDEDRDLAFNHYRRYAQLQQGVRVKGMGLRVWTVDHDRRLLQAEMEAIDPTAPTPVTQRLLNRSSVFPNGVRDLTPVLSSAETASLARRALASEEDKTVRGLSWQDFVHEGALVRDVQITSRRGSYELRFDLATKRLIKKDYHPFEKADQSGNASNLKVEVYPIYEEFAGQIQPRIPVVLKNLSAQVRRPTSDPYANAFTSQLLYSKYDPTLAETPEGRAQGYWSDAILRAQVEQATQAVPLTDNDFSTGDFLLQGKFATVNIHPEAFHQWQGITVPERFTTHFFPVWHDIVIDGEDDTEILPGSARFGKALTTPGEAATWPANRDPSHDPVRYINEGFDELQVYYAVNQMFDSLRPLGFRDPELSTRPFHAILYDPDIAMRDNAYYTNDTINFTTYSPSELNYARDNSTIWHELGHGVMERLMGDFLKLADTGGLSEGMADFVASLVIQDVTGGASFPGENDQRIVNKTGFFLTNEAHDDGEAYGGSMKDILNAAVQQWGQAGLKKMADLTLETMRLSRDNPHLTANDWFNHMIFADEIGRRGVRRPGELHDIILAALQSRNFYPQETERGSLTLTYDGHAVDSGKPGSRGRDIRVTLDPTASQTFTVTATVQDGTGFHFNYPLTLRVYLRTGPLQGAVHWTGEEQTFVDYTINQSGEQVSIPLEVSGTCDSVNREDGSCSDFAYIQVFNGIASPTTKAFGKKRFYVRVANPSTP